MNNNNNSATSSSLPNPVSQQQIKMKKKMVNQQNTRRVPTPEELISHYESKGMTNKQASVKVIDDLQKALFRVVTNKNPQNNMTHQKQKQEMVMMNGTMLRMLDMKIDSKPGFMQVFGIGFASTAVFRGFETLVMPQVFGSFGNIWNAVCSASSSDPKNSV